MKLEKVITDERDREKELFDVIEITMADINPPSEKFIAYVKDHKILASLNVDEFDKKMIKLFG